MRSPPLMLLVVATAALTASYAPIVRANDLPVCNGKHKRSANPYGSVLSVGLKPTLSADTKTSPPVASVKGEATAVPATSAVSPPKVSRADLRASFKPCGDRA